MAAIKARTLLTSNKTIFLSLARPYSGASQICSGCATPVLKSKVPPSCMLSQERYRYADWRMWKDVKRRRAVKEHGNDIQRHLALSNNTILPQEIKQMAEAHIKDSIPRAANPEKVVDRCVVSSKQVTKDLKRWRLGRMVWRHQADYNKLSGFTRAWW